MMRPPLNRRNARWPFWLLLAAWFCANSPQAATYEVVVWLGNARHFSHQQRLRAEVAAILAGPEAPVVVAAVHAAPERPPGPPLPATAALKKVDLFASIPGELILPVAHVPDFAVRGDLPPPAPWREPLSEPPRAA